MPPVRVLIVDDSPVFRKLLSLALEPSSEVQIAGTAASGAMGLSRISQLHPDIITLDMDMPGMNGLQTLAEIRKLYPDLPVIMISTLTARGTPVTLDGLSLGASDYMTKPTCASPADSVMQLRRDLMPKIITLTGRIRAPSLPPPEPRARKKPGHHRIEILAIGTSTGGPNALAAVIPHLPEDFPVPVVIVQHMPPLFTSLLADRLDSQSQLSIHEAEAGQALEAGHVWIARGDYHLTLARKGAVVTLNLNQDQPENSCRPAVDVLFRSVAEVYGASVLAVVMTGMGTDGLHGAEHINKAGGQILAQDQTTSVVWGMPGAVVKAGLADKICPLPEISQEVVRRVTASRQSAMAGHG
jgi:two-component system, chemotaxis family, protein-glutamate methylesterase/glutaminase